MMGDVRILFTRFPLESRLGGAEIQTISLMEGLIARGHAVAFAGSCPTLLSLCRDHHIPAVAWSIGEPPVTKWGVISFLWRKITMKRSLTRLLSQFSDVDAVCMLSLSEKLLLTDVAAAQHKKVLWIEHDRFGRWLQQNPWLPQLIRQSAQATIVTVSALSRQLMTGMGFADSRIVTIPNGVEERRFSARIEAKKSGVFTVGCVARLTRDKGVHILAEAMHDLPDTHLTIVGDGPERTAIPASANTTVMPTVGDVAAFYKTVDVLALPSIDNDPFGMVAAEAMFCGVPVIVTNQCGIAGSLHHGRDAMIVPAGDSAALRQAIIALKTDTPLCHRLSEEAQKTAAAQFPLEKMVDAYDALLKV